MEPITHALISVTLARTAAPVRSRWPFALVVVAGAAPDLDWLARLGGPAAFLDYHRALLHSLAGSVLLAAVLGGVAWWFGRRNAAALVRPLAAMGYSMLGVAGHIMFDLLTSHGVRFLWPFRGNWYGADLMGELDPMLLGLLLFGLLLPLLFGLVTEEIGAKRKGRTPRRGAITLLVLLAAYAGGRYQFHVRAEELLQAHLYHGAAPKSVAAFPASAFPATWRGVVDTETTLEEIEVRSLSPASFDPARSITHYKPEATPALEAARKTESARRFLEFARFPLAEVERTADGWRVELRDLRYPYATQEKAAPFALIELDARFAVLNEEVDFGKPTKR